MVSACIELPEKKNSRDYLLCFTLQKKCHVLKIGSHRASAGKYFTSLISLYTLWRLCPSCVFPNRFRASCLPKFPVSSTSFSINLPYFSLRGTISREAGIPNTSCMIYMIPPANFHNPNSFNSSCTPIDSSRRRRRLYCSSRNAITFRSRIPYHPQAVPSRTTMT